MQELIWGRSLFLQVALKSRGCLLTPLLLLFVYREIINYACLLSTRGRRFVCLIMLTLMRWWLIGIWSHVALYKVCLQGYFAYINLNLCSQITQIYANVKICVWKMRSLTVQMVIKKSEDPGTVDVLSELVIHCVWSSDLSRARQKVRGQQCPFHTDYPSCYVPYA